MLLNTSIRKEIGRNFGAVLFVLLTIVITLVLMRALRFATFGVVNPADTVLFMFFTVIGYSPIILSLCIFIAVVSCFSRLYQDSEIVVWYSSGQGLLQFLRPVLWFGIPIVMAITLLALLVQPWANQQVHNLRVQYAVNQFKLLSPGKFQESRDGTRVVFIDKNQETTDQTPEIGSEVRNIFMWVRNPTKDIIVFAPRARTETINDHVYVILNDGQQLELFRDGEQDTEQLRIAGYGTYGAMVKNAAVSLDKNNPASWPARAQPTNILFRGGSAEQMAELYGRLSLPLLAAGALFLALAVTNRRPRAGKSLNLLYALLLLVTYYNLMVVGENYVRKQELNMWLGLLIVHGGFLLLALVLLFKRHFQYSIRQRLGL